MTVTAKELRFNTSLLFDALEKGEEILITYRGKAKARLIPAKNDKKKERKDYAFGIWQDRDEEVDAQVRAWRKGRVFDA